MSAEALIDALPDLILVVRRDGVVLEHAGGAGVPDLRRPSVNGTRLEALWAEPAAKLVGQLARRAIADRSAMEARFREDGREYEARVSAQGPDRVLCVVRGVAGTSAEHAVEATGTRLRPHLDRRGFLRRLGDSISTATLRELPIALAVIHLDGLSELFRFSSGTMAEQLVSEALLRLSAEDGGRADGSLGWYLGQLSESLLAVVMDGADREVTEACVARICASLRQPIELADTSFQLTAHAGIAIFGPDSSSPRVLLSNARLAATAARRTGSAKPCFFDESLRLDSIARLDVARELQQAIAKRQIRLRYATRHALDDGRLVTWMAYLRWTHPLLGEIRPGEFLSVADATGLGVALSRSVMDRLQEDFEQLAAVAESDVRISFGALRQHIVREDFLEEIEALLRKGRIPPERLELRIAEKTLISRDPGYLERLRERGVRLVADEVGREMGSWDWLARAPLWGMQLDRSWVTALRSDAVAHKVCRAGMAIATALGLIPIATGVDDPAQREALLALGCRYGSGDLYAAANGALHTVPTQAKPD